MYTVVSVVLWNIPSPSSTIVTVILFGCVMVSGVVANAATVNVSSSSSTVSPSMVMGWHIELPTPIEDGMTIWPDSGSKSVVPEVNAYALYDYNHTCDKYKIS